MLLSDLFKKASLPVPAADADVTGFCCDSRKAGKGFVFAAVSGVKLNGEDFIPDALAKGATVVVVDEKSSFKTDKAIVARVPDMRLAVSELAAAFYHEQPETVVAVTGTNGKTSTANFVRQIFEMLGNASASVGTLGVLTKDGVKYGSLTTPDAVTLHTIFDDLAKSGVTKAAMEASSHGLDQHRLDNVRLTAAGFTNITRDHLDYHKTMENYLQAKLKLFDLPLSSKTVVLNADIPEFDRIKNYCETKGLKVIDYGRKAKVIRIDGEELDIKGQTLHLSLNGVKKTVRLHLAGAFQAMNALCALGLVAASGEDMMKAADCLEKLQGTRGRLEHVADRRNGACVYVDYAHTPDGLETVLKALRVHTKNKLHVVFGCGGDRDTGKRAIMGEIADKLADVVYVTDDNPRTEAPLPIRRAILNACPKGFDGGHRALAIKTAVAGLKEGDILVIAGKGHETGQLIQGVMHPFDDREEAIKAVAEADAPLYAKGEIAKAVHSSSRGDFDVYGVSIDTRTIEKGDLYIALIGERLDGHAFAQKAIENGAAGVLVSVMQDGVAPEKQILVADTTQALRDLAVYARARFKGKTICVTGSSGKTSTKEMLRYALTPLGKTFATAGNLNNQTGVPLTLARLPQNADFAVIETGMNHAGELTDLSSLTRPDAAIVTMVGAAHCEFFKTPRDTARAKAELFSHMNKNGIAVLNKDNDQYDFLKEQAIAYGVKKFLSFGSNAGCDLILKEYANDKVSAVVGGKEISYALKPQGRHQALNSLAVLGVVEAFGLSVEDAASGVMQTPAAAGRGAKHTVALANGSFTLIDDAYNANPDSMKASLAVLGAMCPEANGRRIAVLGDMGELGAQAQALHLSLKDDLINNRIDKFVAVGEKMSALHDSLPESMRGGCAQNAEQAADLIAKIVRAGDVVSVKASHSMHLEKIVERFLKP